MVGMTFLGAALVLGCNHGARHCSTCSTGTVTPPMANPYYMTPAPAPALRPVPGSSYHQAEPQAPMPLAEAPVVKPPVAPAAADVEVEQSAYSNSLREAKEEMHRRRTFRDITADPCFAHAADYSSITGELRFDKVRKAWTVRYASAEDDDKYGGSVTLADMPNMADFMSGQMVQVDGRLVDAETHESLPPYQVSSMKHAPMP
jgi:hypothetical protein